VPAPLIWGDCRLPFGIRQWIITTERVITGPASQRLWSEPYGSIVVVEDPLVQKFLRSVLFRNGYQVVEASPATALSLIAGPEPRARVVITNRPEVFLPFADDVAMLYVAACPDYTLALRFQTCRILHKPFHPADLLEAVEDLAVSL
jgi:hypothetical protein